MKDMVIGQERAGETADGHKVEEPEDYDADEQIVAGDNLEKPQQKKQPENIGRCGSVENNWVNVWVCMGRSWNREWTSDLSRTTLGSM